MLIGGFQKSSLIDYPEKISAIVFTLGCNFRCPYCHNPELILGDCGTSIEVPQIFEFLKTRIGKLDGVVITGGEPCCQKNLLEFINQIKQLGFLVKLDTNGTYPDKIIELLNAKVLDYIAMDIKAPLSKYSSATNANVNVDKIAKSIEIIMNSGVDYEFRTTVVKSQLTFDDFDEIGKLINGAKKYYLQKFVSTKLLDKNFKNETSYSDKEFEVITSNLKKYIQNSFVR